MKNTFIQLSAVLTREDKKYLFYVLILSALVSVIESIAISLIMPFVSLAMDLEKVYSDPRLSMVFRFFNFSHPTSFIYFFGFALIVFYIIRGILNTYYFYSLTRLSEKLNDNISIKLFKRYMLISYESFVKKNSSEIAKLINYDVFYFTSCLQSALFLISEILVVFFIYCAMLYVNYKITISVSLFLVFSGLIFIKIFSKKVKSKGEQRLLLQKYFYEVLNSTLGNFKLIKLQSHNDNVLNKFSKARVNLGQINTFSNFIGHFPRILLETVSFIFIIAITLGIIWKFSGNISSFLPTISVFLLGLFRLMPSANRIISNYNNLLFQMKSIEGVYNNFQEKFEILGEEPIGFEKEIKLNNIRFSYDNNTSVLKEINLTILKGDRVAFTGKSGSGKSTLVDLISGLLTPTSGNILIDGKTLTPNNMKAFRKKIGYIPQNVYLFDGTIAENVAFENEYDETKVIRALKNARIYDFLEKTTKGIHTEVGEGGICLSGGQRQRVAIARALYSNPDIFILDEATSALDNETEAEIMDEIYDISRDKTLIIIAHRLSTVSRCNKIFEISDGTISN